ncbi:MAG: hypothetical protein ACPHAN_15490 [Pseudomonadales bacterium]
MVAGNSSISRAVSLLIGVYLTLGGARAIAGGQSIAERKALNLRLSAAHHHSMLDDFLASQKTVSEIPSAWNEY